ncbi:hypothetical protein GCK72_009035 [Caenorhabditis remanei]|uniref:Uncharacterized protein n=1 Tax=Caenorhabditis remanei TaxID=31234 RepID=A0A6A5H1J0_CAERE|nr:hypothetical protein GCK72_009035 [Caenorhabditis remanei]KAF1760785.1 hypothetical protein GCK72_009035 [Caenorhabditis remanei]
MKLILLFLLLVLLTVELEAVGGKREAVPAPSTAKGPNFGHSNSELWRPRGRRNKRWYFWYRRYYGGYSRRSYYYWYRNYYSNYYSNYYYSYYYGKKK